MVLTTTECELVSHETEGLDVLRALGELSVPCARIRAAWLLLSSDPVEAGSVAGWPAAAIEQARDAFTWSEARMERAVAAKQATALRVQAALIEDLEGRAARARDGSLRQRVSRGRARRLRDRKLPHVDQGSVTRLAAAWAVLGDHLDPRDIARAEALLRAE